MFINLGWIPPMLSANAMWLWFVVLYNWEGGSCEGNSFCPNLHLESQTGAMFTQERQTLDEHFKELPKWQEGSVLSCTASFHGPVMLYKWNQFYLPMATTESSIDHIKFVASFFFFPKLFV